MKVRIKVGAPVWQDFRAMRWPSCLEYHGGWTAPDPNMVFDAERNSKGWDCRADGYGFGINGKSGKYGNGSIQVIGDDQVEILDQSTPVFRLGAEPVVLHGAV